MGGLFSAESKVQQPRPPSRAEIGRAAWRYIHALAADYPEQPTVVEQAQGLNWLRAFIHLYPCQLCSREFVEVCSDLPPRLSGREDYAMWWCEAHNRVRADLSQSLRRCEKHELIAAGRAGQTLDEYTGFKGVETPAIQKISGSGAGGDAPSDCAACSVPS
mmetsp:Transcript_14019/g.30454  ORF Transcript_14019/g.30454 Transcript_14019/m.30454 type:complete len:161 (+) Transcript_14019:156-638(+)